MPNSQTRRRSAVRSPKPLNDLQWLANPYEQLRRSLSFSGKAVSDEEFYRFFEMVGEVAENPNAPRSNRNTTRRSPRAAGANSPKATAAKSPKATGAKSPKPTGAKAGKSPKAAGAKSPGKP